MIKDFWSLFLQEKQLNSNLKYEDAFYFGSNEKQANDLLKLVAEGKKVATSSSFYAYQKMNEKIPKVGDYFIVTDYNKVPKIIIKTIDVKIVLFKEMTFDLAKLEGEDENLKSWRDNHFSFFKEEAKEVGYKFDENMPVVFEEFVVVFIQRDK